MRACHLFTEEWDNSRGKERSRAGFLLKRKKAVSPGLNSYNIWNERQCLNTRQLFLWELDRSLNMLGFSRHVQRLVGSPLKPGSMVTSSLFLVPPRWTPLKSTYIYIGRLNSSTLLVLKVGGNVPHTMGSGRLELSTFWSCYWKEEHQEKNRDVEGFFFFFLMLTFCMPFLEKCLSSPESI